jgi:hypothetical protein
VCTLIFCLVLFLLKSAFLLELLDIKLENLIGEFRVSASEIIGGYFLLFTLYEYDFHFCNDIQQCLKTNNRISSCRLMNLEDDEFRHGLLNISRLFAVPLMNLFECLVNASSMRIVDKESKHLHCFYKFGIVITIMS